MINEDFSNRKKCHDIGRWYVGRFVESVAGSLSPGSDILDAGAGESVYKRHFSHCNYKAIDLGVGESKWNYSNLDYVGALDNMPIADNQFHAVLCTQVLEHLEWPRESAKEMYRVLRPGGKLFLTVPMAQNEHQVPYDFFRYTSFGIKSICANAGFKDIEVTPFGGLWVRWAYELPRGFGILPSNGFLGVAFIPLRLVARVVVRALQYLFLWLDGFDAKKNDPWGWACVATK